MSAPIGRVLTGVAGALAPALAALAAMALVVGVPAAASHGRDDALRSWTGGDGRAAVVVVQTRATGSAPNTTAEAAILGAVAPVPVLTRHVFATAPLEATWEGGAGDLVLASLRSDEGLDLFFDRSGRESLGGIASGRMPEVAGEAIVDAPTAERLGIELGDVVRIDDRDDTEIVGIWSPSTAGVRLLGATGLDRGGVITTDDAVFVGDSAPYERWMLELDPTRFDAVALADGRPVADRITEALAATGIPTAGIVVDDRLSPELERLATGVDTSGRILAGFTVIGGAIAVIALIQLGGLIASARTAELELIRTRGASRRRIAASAGTVVGLAALAGATAAAGIIGALALVGLAVLHPLQLLVAPVALALVAGIAVGVACAALPGRQPARRGILTRAIRPLALTAIVVVAALAVVALWTGSDASPIAIAAPALALVAAMAIVLVIAGPLARLLASGRIRGSAGFVAARRISRRPQRFAPVTAIIALQVGILVIAAATSGSALTISADARTLETGAAVRAIGVTAAEQEAAALGAAVLTDRLEWGGNRIDLVAMTPAGASGTIAPVAGAVEPDRLATALGGVDDRSAAEVGAGIGDGPATLMIMSTSATELWFADASGTLAHRAIDEGEQAIELPAGPDWRLLAIEGTPDAEGRWVIDQLLVDDVPIDLGGWDAAQERAGAEGITASAAPFGDGLKITAALVPTGLAVEPTGSITTAPVRLVPGEPTPVPAVVDSAVAGGASLEIGDSVVARVAGAGRELEGVVTAVVPAIPGTGTVGGIMLELRTMIAAQLRTAEAPPTPDERWFGSDEAVAATAFAWPDSVSVRTSAPGVHDHLVATALVAAWASAGIALVLAAIALVAAIGQRLRLDRLDAAALQSMGMSAAGMRSTWMRETAPLAAAAVVIGAIAGFAAAAATVPITTWRGVPAPPVLLDPVLRIEPVGLAVSLVVVVVVIAAVLTRGAVVAGRSAAVIDEGSSR